MHTYIHTFIHSPRRGSSRCGQLCKPATRLVARHDSGAPSTKKILKRTREHIIAKVTE